MSARQSQRLIEISLWIDEANALRPAEVNLWSRVTKASEEAGEAQSALRGMLGENPRKGVTATQEDVEQELLDTAVAALGAIEHIRGHDGQALRLLMGKIDTVWRRAGLGDGE